MWPEIESGNLPQPEQKIKPPFYVLYESIRKSLLPSFLAGFLFPEVAVLRISSCSIPSPSHSFIFSFFSLSSHPTSGRTRLNLCLSIQRYFGGRNMPSSEPQCFMRHKIELDVGHDLHHFCSTSPKSRIDCVTLFSSLLFPASSKDNKEQLDLPTIIRLGLLSIFCVHLHLHLQTQAQTRLEKLYREGESQSSSGTCNPESTYRRPVVLVSSDDCDVMLRNLGNMS
ncbi:hypothetical protein BKA64DRAFT_62046 [Cadophora sp. MPI-SDFR-AT-0126]|nr:hypothetical protein BKA64DRAFT_62046 [Leotiomycetes sp. MPI-SDFR-AT-0126]